MPLYERQDVQLVRLHDYRRLLLQAPGIQGLVPLYTLLRRPG